MTASVATVRRQWRGSSFPTKCRIFARLLDGIREQGRGGVAVGNAARWDHRQCGNAGPGLPIKPRHASFPLPGGLVGIFRAIVYVSVLPVLHTLEHLPLRGAIAVQLVGDHHLWDVLASVEALPAELLGCRLIPSALPQDIAHVTVLLHRPPQLMALPIDRQKDLIEMPRVAWSRAATAHLVGIRLPKLPAPRADRFVRHEYTTREQQFLDVAVAEAEPVIQPDTMADALDRGAMILLAVGWG